VSLSSWRISRRISAGRVSKLDEDEDTVSLAFESGAFALILSS